MRVRYLWRVLRVLAVVLGSLSDFTSALLLCCDDLRFCEFAGGFCSS